MLINELSKKMGAPIPTIRYYENLGLLKGTTNENVKTNKYKNYDDSHVERIEIIKRGQEVGSSLAEIKVLLDKWFYGISTQVKILNFFESKITEFKYKCNNFFKK